ncbi:hypothetical protein MXD63_45865, partial [Frankia sp. Cpl3]|nr:hypothetical protein [Frankia sp. Cpl3]
MEESKTGNRTSLESLRKSQANLERSLVKMVEVAAMSQAPEMKLPLMVERQHQTELQGMVHNKK